jgi:dihydroneopterin aldolase
MLDKIRLSRIQFYGYHGVYPEENKLGARYLVDLELSLSLQQAGQTDDLNQTIDYAHIYERVKVIMEGQTVKLIETLAERIASDLLHTYTQIMELTITVVKPDPPFPALLDGVAVQITRKRA